MPGSTMTSFTRILHTGEPDHLMDEIPTVVVERGPKPDEGGPPIQRPTAVIRWLEQAWPKEDYVLMLEPDHILLRPVPLGNVTRGAPLAFFFSCAPSPSLGGWGVGRPDDAARRARAADVNIEEFSEVLEPYLRRAGCAAAAVPRTGNSPSLMHKDDLRRIGPAWSEYSIALHGDAGVRKSVGWVGEMYGFSLAACALGMQFQLQAQELMIHPPFDTAVGETKIIHFTYGVTLFANGSFADPGKTEEAERVFKFDKRYYKPAKTGLIPEPPPGTFESARRLVASINEAVAATFPPAPPAPLAPQAAE